VAEASEIFRKFRHA